VALTFRTIRALLCMAEVRPAGSMEPTCPSPFRVEHPLVPPHLTERGACRGCRGMHL